MGTPAAHWEGHPVDLGEGCTLRKQKGKRVMVAVCAVYTHQLGWELVLIVDDEFSRSQGYKSTEEVLTVTEQLAAALDGRVRPSVATRRRVALASLGVMPDTKENAR